jgi:hypothetical protein
MALSELDTKCIRRISTARAKDLRVRDQASMTVIVLTEAQNLQISLSLDEADNLATVILKSLTMWDRLLDFSNKVRVERTTS